MEFQLNAAGKRIFPSEFKRRILDDLKNGVSTHELARKYSIPMQNIVYWKRSADQAVLGKAPSKKKKQFQHQNIAGLWKRIKIFVNRSRI